MGFVFGGMAAFTQTKRNGITNDLFSDYILIAGPLAIVCTRMYYVIFNLHLYRGNWLGIFAFRDGGGGVYGGIIAAFASLYFFSRYHSKKKKLGTTTELMGKIGDTGVFGLVIGQIIGRMGNFTNQEAFGGYTDGLFAMQLKVSNIPDRTLITDEMLLNSRFVESEMVRLVQVHPAFLYEMMLNACILIFLWFYRKHKKFMGELVLIYAAVYSLGRFFIERLRTDPLYFWGTGIPASMITASLMFIGAVTLIVYIRVKKNAKTNA
jgi:phosphatidylglycerol:prolipoprotein diacylglycerol transferase